MDNGKICIDASEYRELCQMAGQMDALKRFMGQKGYRDEDTIRTIIGVELPEGDE